jgi:hypothetical protein
MSVSWRGCVAIYLAGLVVNSREGGRMLAVGFNGKMCVSHQNSGAKLLMPALFYIFHVFFGTINMDLLLDSC